MVYDDGDGRTEFLTKIFANNVYKSTKVIKFCFKDGRKMEK